MNEEEKKAIELLEDIKNNTWTTKYIMSSDSKNAKVLLNLIEKLQKENDGLKFEERSRIIGKYGEVEIHDVINRTLSNDYISVEKIKDKIEHYQKLQDNYIEKYDEINEGLQAMINALQELLEGRK